eukprot:8775657-Prorocentrum_lima.AAC.1
MTSSLVGSEMCIRDSSCCAANTSTEPWPSPPKPRRANATGFCTAALHVSVSYTHLTLPTICSV